MKISKSAISVFIRSALIIIFRFFIATIVITIPMRICNYVGYLWVAYFGILVAIIVRWDKIVKKFKMKKRAFNSLCIIGSFLYIVSFIVIAISVVQIQKADNNKIWAEKNDVTVIVLGCQVIGQTPSPMLQSRIDSAVQYLKSNLNAKVVGSGQLGKTATISEGEAIKNSLVKAGIDENRIFVEGTAKNTKENLQHSEKIIRENNLPTDVVIVTDSWHEKRGQYYAEKVGLQPYSYSCKTDPFLYFYYYFREVLAVATLPLVN